MRQTRAKLLALLTSILLLNAAAHAQTDERSRAAAPDAPEISYTVSMPRPHTHMLEVEMRVCVTRARPRSVDLRMPVWTPGSYLVREFARHVQDFAASGESGGSARRGRKINKNTWRVETAGCARRARALLASTLTN